MNIFVQSPCRPWGQLQWALDLSHRRQWHIIGCLSTEERSVEPLIELQQMNLLASCEFVRVHDDRPEDTQREEAAIEQRLLRCKAANVSMHARSLPLNIRVNRKNCPEAFDYENKSSLCIDISTMPKRFFFPIVRAALLSDEVKDLILLYSKPRAYPDGELSSSPQPWNTIDQFKCPDDEIEKKAEKHLIINTGFIVGGLVEYISDPKDDLHLDILVPFPADPWNSIRRSWKSAHAIENEIRHGHPLQHANYHRVAALDASSAFDRLLSLTEYGKNPAALAPLGPKPTSLAMCLLSSQTDFRHPVYYAQPEAYAINYSEGYESTYAYWIKHDGDNLYALPN